MIPEGHIWRYRPDFLIWGGGSASAPTVAVLEVLGFPPGANPDYDQGTASKKSYYQSLSDRLLYHEEPAWKEARKRDESVQEKAWDNPPRLPGFVSPAARKLIRERLQPL